MNIHKNKEWTCLKDDHLKDIYKIASSNMSPNYDKFVAEKRCDGSN